jgi:hypothetical protein
MRGAFAKTYIFILYIMYCPSRRLGGKAWVISHYTMLMVWWSEARGRELLASACLGSFPGVGTGGGCEGGGFGGGMTDFRLGWHLVMSLSTVGAEYPRFTGMTKIGGARWKMTLASSCLEGPVR